MDARSQHIAALFKQVDGGYVFRLPFPLAFRNSPRYLVTEAQKAEIVARLVPARPYLWACMLVGAVVGATIVASLTVWLLSPHPSPTAIDTVALAALSFILIAAEILVFRRWRQNQLAPVLAQLKPTELPFTLQEAKAAAARAMSVRQTMFVVACMAIGALFTTFGAVVAIMHGQTAGYVQLAAGLTFAVLTGYWTKRLIERWRASAVGG